jgi:hypothetical protein
MRRSGRINGIRILMLSQEGIGEGEIVMMMGLIPVE